MIICQKHARLVHGSNYTTIILYFPSSFEIKIGGFPLAWQGVAGLQLILSYVIIEVIASTPQ
jgi:hypothetical protein